MRKNKKVKKKIEEIKLTMKFNPGIMKFEPVLPFLNLKKKSKNQDEH